MNENSAFLGGRIYLRTEGYYDADGSLRFFGVGPETHSQDESGYTGHDKVIHARHTLATKGDIVDHHNPSAAECQ